MDKPRGGGQVRVAAVGCAPNAIANNYAGILFPSPPTGVGDGGSAPSLIAPGVAQPVRREFASPTLPRDAWCDDRHDALAAWWRISIRARCRGTGARSVDGISCDGRRVASGVHFVRVETLFETSTMKIVRVE
jgi:hypothetical protein